MTYCRLLLALAAVAVTTMTADAQRILPPSTEAQVQAPSAAAAAILAKYAPVTAERLLKPEDENWLSIRRTYDGWGFSPLAQITPANVSRMKMVWTLPTNETAAHQAAPIVNDGVMFVTTPQNQVIAFEAATGDVLWRYKRPRPQGAFVLHQGNRGVALYGDKVYFAAGEAILVAIDAKTGREVWATEVANNKEAYYLTLAPLVANGKVMIGASGGEFGIRGFVAAYDPDSGKELWKTYTVPAPGEPGSETWPKGDHWKTGAAPVWVTGNYDPETNLSYWGTGNGGPWMGDQRPGDNLYVASTVAIDVASGEIKGHFQYTPNESWDWDEVSPPLLIDYRRGTRNVRGLVNFARNGYVWFLERTNGGPINFVEGKPYVNQNVFLRLDPKTGRPEIDPDRKPGTGKIATFCPSAHGGKNWPPAAYSPLTRMIYVPANNNLCGSMMGVPVTYTAGRGFAGTQSQPGSLNPGADHVGEVQAWNVDTGQKVWTHEYRRSPNWGSMLATAGGLVFSGGTVDRNIHAFDAMSGKLLWEFTTNSGILAPPSMFRVNGKDYLAVLTGWAGDARGMANQVSRYFPGEVPAVPEGSGQVYVFALE
jgi:alcohol dehydrogenase (cytochrome c)